MGAVPQGPYLYQSETLGNEFSVLTYACYSYLSCDTYEMLMSTRDFLETLDERSFFTPPPATVAPSLMSAPSYNASSANVENSFSTSSGGSASMPPPDISPDNLKEELVPNILPAATKTERFLLTAADQESGSRDERLNRVIRSKYEAGLLKPYNYVKGYARLSRWMDRKYVSHVLALRANKLHLSTEKAYRSNNLL